jgi:NADH:ubiquinone oxidoreductase subunit E
VSGSGDDVVEQVGVRKHARAHEEVPQELRGRVPRFGHGSRVPGWDDAVDLEKDPIEVPDLATTPVPDDLRSEMEAHMAKYPDRRSAALPCLAAAQKVHGWCSPEAITQTAAVMRLTPAYLVSVASFYDMLDTRPIGRHRVYVCTNISCSLNGGRQLNERLKAQVGDDPDIQVRGFECLGACDIAPMASVDGVYVGPVDLDEVPELVEQIRAGQPPLPAKQLARRPSVDPNAGMPGPPTIAGEMPGDQPGPSAPLEQAPDPPEGPEPTS